MRPAVFTFYSYKGGVGRTVLAANMALALARRGKTLIWDLDVEAPGLHRITALQGTGEIKAGFFDWLLAWQSDKLRQPDQASLEKFAQLLRQTPFANLTLLPAHGEQQNSLALYYRIDWHALLAQDPTLGRDVLNALIAHLGTLGYRHVVIDARTGLSDLGGLLSGAIPDATVLVGGYGRQNLGGLGQIARSLAEHSPQQRSLRARDAKLRLFYCASPIPQDDAALVKTGREIWARELGLELAAVQEIRYDPALPFSEALLITQPERAIAIDYERLATQLLIFADELLEADLAQQRQMAERPDVFGDVGSNSNIAALSFAARVAELLRLLGYTVQEGPSVDGAQLDLQASIESGLDSTTYLVQCHDQSHSLPQASVQQLHARLALPQASAMQARGMVVAHSISPAAQTWARDHAIQALTPLELERRLLDFAPHLNKIIANFEQSPLARTYVTQHAHAEANAGVGAGKRGGKTRLAQISKANQASQTKQAKSGKNAKPAKQKPADITDLIKHGLAWANGEGKRLWILLGDYGTGKTAFTQKLEYELAKRAQSDSTCAIPLRINLREVPNKVTLDELLADGWLRATGQRKDPRVLQYLIQRGRIVLLLDSFDEMGLATAGRSVVEQFRSLARLAGEAGPTPLSNRVLLTCREQFFKDHGDASHAMRGMDEEIAAQSALQGLALGFDGSIDTVAMFTAKQIAEFLKKSLGKQAGADALKFLEKQNLLQLGDRPQLLDIIIQSMPKLKQQEAASGHALSTGALYQIYTDKWLDDYKPVERQSNSEQLRCILAVLAQELWQREGNRMHYGDLFLLIKDRADLRGKLDPNQLDVELRTAAFLSRTPDGFYGFSHRSFLEFFFARHIVQTALACQASANVLALQQALNLPRLSDEIGNFVSDIAPIATSENAAHPARAALRQSIHTLLGANQGAPAASRVNALILAMRLSSHDCHRQEGGGNIEQLPEARQTWLPPAPWLAGTDLSGLDMFYLQATDADFSATKLSRADLSYANLQNANLQDADASNFFAVEINLIGAQAQRSIWRGAWLEDAKIDGCDFTAADLRGAVFRSACGQALLTDALLDEDTNLPRQPSPLKPP